MPSECSGREAQAESTWRHLSEKPRHGASDRLHVKRGSSSLPMVPDSIGLIDEASPRCTFQIM